MQDDFSDIYEPPKPKRGQGEHLSWQEIWTMVVTDGSVDAFYRILDDPKATASRAILWIFLITTFSGIVNSILTFAQWNSIPTTGFPNTFNPTAIFLPTLLCSTLLGGVFGVIGLFISGGIIHLIAKMLGGKGTFNEWIYIYGAIAAPFVVISLIMSAISVTIPAAGIAFLCISLVVVIYQFILQGRGLMALHGFTGGQAAGTLLIAIFGMMAVGFVIAMCILSAFMGDIMGDFYPQLIQTLQAATPYP